MTSVNRNISSRQAQDVGDQQKDVRSQVARQLDQVDSLLRRMRTGQLNVKQLAKLNLKALTQEAKAHLAKELAQEMKGLLPAQVHQAIMKGDVDDPRLSKLVEQFVQQFGDKGLPVRPGAGKGKHAAQAKGQAGAAAAKGGPGTTDELATTKQGATKWQQYAQTSQVQKHVSTGRLAQKILEQAGEKKNLLSVLTDRNQAAARGKGQARGSTSAAGMRSPHLVHKEGLQRFSPAQQRAMLTTMFGRDMLDKLGAAGVKDLVSLLAKGAGTEGRAELAKLLGMGRGALLTKLMSSELLGIGPGSRGEAGLQPETLSLLMRGGVFSMGTLAALKGLPRGELAHLFKLMRKGPEAFKRSLGGQRPIVKKDINHWSQRASRSRSAIVLADPDELEGGLDPDESQEHVAAWYLEALFYEELEEYRWLEQHERERQERERQQEEDRRREEEEERDRDDPLLIHPDPESPSGLVCFWVEEHNLSPRKLGGITRRYVCIDPQSGAIIPKGVEGGDVGEYIDLATRTDGYNVSWAAKLDKKDGPLG